MTSQHEEHELFKKNKFKEVSKLIKQNSKILDIGCNNGNIRFSLKNPDYYGTDLDKDFLEHLRSNNIPAESVDLNKDPLPFKDHKFDYILLLDVLEHVVDPKLLLQNSKEKLNSNGKLVITLPNDYHILNKIRFVFNKHLTEDPFHPFGHLHYFPIKSGEIFLKNNGLKILKKIPIPPTKPSFLPQSFKNFLGNNFQQSFARDILYLLEPIRNKNYYNSSSILSSSKIFIKNPSLNKYLFVLRDNKKNIFYPNHWSIIGGALDPGESPKNALFREISEEINLTYDKPIYLKKINIKAEKQGKLIPSIIHIFKTNTNFQLDKIILYEGQKCKYFTIDEFLKLDNAVPFLKKFIIDNKDLF